jgi:hypothetical protein
MKPRFDGDTHRSLRRVANLFDPEDKRQNVHRELILEDSRDSGLEYFKIHL